MTRLVRAVPHAEPGGLESFLLSQRGVRRARLTPEWGLAIGARRDPIRIQRRRTKGWRMPDGAVYVGRPSKYSNPWKVGERYMWLAASVELPYPLQTSRDVGEYPDGTRVEVCPDVETAITWFRAWLGTWAARPLADLRRDLAGRDLACWCRLDRPCHADVLIEVAAALPACTRADRCDRCRKADLCERDGYHSAAHAFRLLCADVHGREADVAQLYTREAAADAVLAELNSLTTTPEGQAQ